VGVDYIGCEYQEESLRTILDAIYTSNRWTKIKNLSFFAMKGTHLHSQGSPG
jgi:hypothetical protein